MSGGWASSTRKATLPPDWPARVEATRRRARTTRWPAGAGQCEKVWREGDRFKRCKEAGADCDHKSDRLNHDDLWILCTKHHQIKTQAEAQQGKVAAAEARKRRRHTDLPPGRRRF